MIGVVDDDESVRDTLSSLIRSAGYHCAVFRSAEAFLESGRLTETHCMVLDVRMPGMSGPDLQVRLREMNRALPVIFVTGCPDDKVRARVLRNRTTAYLDKPFSDDDLLGTVDAALKR